MLLHHEYITILCWFKKRKIFKFILVSAAFQTTQKYMCQVKHAQNVNSTYLLDYGIKDDLFT